MTRLGRTWGLAAAAVACVGAVALGGCGDEPADPPGTTADVAPIGELAGATVPLEDDEFSTVLALTVETFAEGRTLIAGQLDLARAGDTAEVRLTVDGQEERSAEARQAPGGALVIACACEVDAGEHEIELEARSSGGPVPVAARSLIALDGVEYAGESEDAAGPLPPALSGAEIKTTPVLVTGSAVSLAEASVAGAESADQSLILAQIGSTKPTADTSGVALQAGIAGEEADRLASLTAASTKIDAFGLGSAPAAGGSAELLGNVVGGGTTELNLISLIVCPCGLETES